nr:uncharacterized protein LOC122269307 [Parasteatoda tepidariorum]
MVQEMFGLPAIKNITTHQNPSWSISNCGRQISTRPLGHCGTTFPIAGIHLHPNVYRSPDAIPLKDLSAESVANAFFSGWVARFGVPEIITTDQGRNFESNLFLALSKSLGTKRNRTTAYHPSANGLIERFHRQLKGALRCSLAGTERWIEKLPIVFLGIRTALKEDLSNSTAELVYGCNHPQPGEFFSSISGTKSPQQLLLSLKEHFR